MSDEEILELLMYRLTDQEPMSPEDRTLKWCAGYIDKLIKENERLRAGIQEIEKHAPLNAPACGHVCVRDAIGSDLRALLAPVPEEDE